MTIGILTAMARERTQVANLVKDSTTVSIHGRPFVKGKIGQNTILLGETGIGKVNAALGTLELINEVGPDAIISTGVAGGLDARLMPLDAIAASGVVYHDVYCGPGNEYGQVQGLPHIFDADPRLLEVLGDIDCDTRIFKGLMCSGDKFIEPPEDAAIKMRFPNALAVDMELGGIAQACYRSNLPFASVRIISDVPGGDKRISQYENFWETAADNSFGVLSEFLSKLPDSLD